MVISIGDRKIEPGSREELMSIVEEASTAPYVEIWLTGKGETGLCLLINESRAFLMYLRFKGDSGFRSNNALADVDRDQKFLLSNGQMEEYPEGWTIDKDKIEAVILTYADTGDMDNCIDWVEC